MRILLISANTERLNMPTLPRGLACVAAAVRRAGHEVRIVGGSDRSVFGLGQIILRDSAGVLWGGSDPRGDGCALGF